MRMVGTIMAVTLALYGQASLASDAMFRLQSIVLPDPKAHVFLGDGDGDAVPDVFVLHGHMLTAHYGQGGRGVGTVNLGEGTSVFDIADLDGDGYSEVIAICGRQIQRHDFTGEQASGAPKILFELATQYGQTRTGPFARVLTTTRLGATLLALPCEEAVEIRTPNGNLVESLPLKPLASDGDAQNGDFASADWWPPRVGRIGDIEKVAWRTLAFETSLSLGKAVPPDGGEAPRRGRISGARDAANLPSSAWPWFALQLRQGAGGTRILYSLAPPSLRDTLLTVRTTSERGIKEGSSRRYKGAIIVPPETLPDFNGDGYVDALFWTAPQPGPSVNSLTRAATGASWPLRLTVHLFDPTRNRYAARASARLDCTLPVPWFLSYRAGIPMRNAVFRDFNGDGRTDLAFSTDARSFSVWLHTEKGLSERPDFHIVFTEPVDELAFQGEAADGVHFSLGFRSKKHIFVLHPIL